MLTWLSYQGTLFDPMRGGQLFQTFCSASQLLFLGSHPTGLILVEQPTHCVSAGAVLLKLTMNSGGSHWEQREGKARSGLFWYDSMSIVVGHPDFSLHFQQETTLWNNSQQCEDVDKCQHCDRAVSLQLEIFCVFYVVHRECTLQNWKYFLGKCLLTIHKKEMFYMAQCTQHVPVLMVQSKSSLCSSRSSLTSGLDPILQPHQPRWNVRQVTLRATQPHYVVGDPSGADQLLDGSRIWCSHRAGYKYQTVLWWYRFL